MQYTVAGVLSTAAARRAARNLGTFATPDAAIAAMQRVADDCDTTITFDIIMCVDDEGEDRWAVDTPAYRVSPDYDEPLPDNGCRCFADCGKRSSKATQPKSQSVRLRR